MHTSCPSHVTGLIKPYPIDEMHVITNLAKEAKNISKID
jgi:hypothetical protein